MSLIQYIHSLKENKELKLCIEKAQPSLVTDGWRKYKERARSEFGDNTICLFQVGSFFECYYEDAYILSKVLNIALTKRNSSNPYSAPMSGFGVDFLDERVKVLTQSGLFVYVVTQNEDIETKKISRTLDKIYYPTTGKSLGEYILSITFQKEWVIDLLELGTLQYDRYSFSKLDKEAFISLIEKYNTSTIIVYKNDIVAKAKLRDFQLKYEIKEVDGIDKRISPVKIYGKKIFFDSEAIDSICPIEHRNLSNTMSLSYMTLNNLEVLKTKEGETGSLFDTINFTCTPMGRRMLFKSISSPYNNEKDIKVIQNHIKAIHKEGTEKLNHLRTLLFSVGDIDLIIGKIINNRLLPKDVILLCHLFNTYKEILSLLGKNVKDSLNQKINTFLSNFENIFQEGGNKVSIKSGNIFVLGYDKQLDDYINIIEKIDEKKMELLNKVIAKTKIPFSYFETVNNLLFSVQNKKLPRTFSLPEGWKELKSTTAQRRFSSKELEELWSKYLMAEKYRNSYEYDLFKKVKGEILAYIPCLREINDKITYLDFLLSAENLLQLGWTFPVIHNGTELRIVEGRHPMLEKVVGAENIIPNNVFLGEKTYKCLTGINMGGKTIYMKMLGLITLLSHAGFPIPAKEGYIGIKDNIFVRAGASDNFLREQSTFKLEMEELAYIMNNYTENSLILIDEVGRGTDVRDGYPIALAVSEEIIERKAHCIFATHFHEIALKIKEYTNAGNLHVKILEDGGDIIFTHKIQEGEPETDNSYGIHIAELSKLGKGIIDRAYQIKREL